jgi:Secretion system C-terminal sorting domain
MKKIQICIDLFVSILLITNAMYATNTSIQPSFRTIMYSNGAYSQGVSQVIGSNSYATYRTQLTFSLSNIPSNAVVTSVTLTLSGNAAGPIYKMAAICLPNPITYDANGWNSFANATKTYFQDVSYDNSTDLSNTQFTSDVKSAISSGSSFSIGIVSESENQNNSYTQVISLLNITYTVPSSYTISGYIKASSGLAISGVSMSGLPNAPSTDANGYYSGTVSQGWSGAVTPTKSGHSFSPTSTTYNSITSNQSVNYTDNTQYSITVKNSYGSGNLVVDGSSYSSGVSFNWLIGTSHLFQANDNISYMDNNDNSYTLHFINWTTPTGTVTGNPITPTITTSGTYTANIEGICISGTSSLQKGNKATCTALVVGGSGSYSYQWYEQSNGSSWYSLGVTTQSTVINMILWDINLRVDVHDNVLGSTLSAYHTIGFNSGNNQEIRLVGYDGARTTTSETQEPMNFNLSRNYPNPFNPTTNISYQLPENAKVSLKVYDVLGREVATLVDGMKETGSYTATFDGSHFASGIYFAKIVVNLQSGNKLFVQVKKMLMMK